MKALSVQQFDDYFREIHGYLPFSWQRVLADRICRGDWPRYVKAPTASGKTSLVDITVFAMASQAHLPPPERTAPRRVFFVVDRRIVVDETFHRGCKIAKALHGATSEQPVLQVVSERLRHVAAEPDGAPLDCVQLRGGIYCDDHWIRSPTQPTVIASTVDQVGSRLLFRGYGVSESARPIHAALVGNDALIVLDEAHLSRPFSDTLRAIVRYRQNDWAAHPVRTPFQFVEMTATPPTDSNESVFSIDDPDVLKLASDEPSRDRELQRRRGSSKPVRLIRTDCAKGSDQGAALAETIVEQTEKMTAEHPLVLGIIVNRVVTARRVYEALQTKHHGRVHLMIGRMRPIDRDDLAERLRPGLTTGSKRLSLDAPTIVVATQCLEVGADFDFDALITECASIDALRQRFGRLNRAGREIATNGAVLIRGDQALTNDQIAKLEDDGQQEDAIYGNALARTWNWLNEIATDGIVDFGVDAMAARCELLREHAASLRVESVRAPVLFPAYLDHLVQTSPAPQHDLDLSLFLHGPQRNDPEVQVCWRADLPTSAEGLNEVADAWIQAVSLLPPSSAECLSVPIGVARRWLRADDGTRDEGGDVPARTTDDEQQRGPYMRKRRVLIWRGVRKSTVVFGDADVRPGDTLVLPVESGGWSTFGYIPNAPNDPAGATPSQFNLGAMASVDQAEQAFVQAQDKAVVRVHVAFRSDWPEGQAAKSLFELATDVELNLAQDELQELLKTVAPDDGLLSDRLTRGEIVSLANHKLRTERYADGRGMIVKSRRRLGRRRALLSLDDGEDVLSAMEREEPVALSDHTRHVRAKLDQIQGQLPLTDWVGELQQSADLHDWGKADERFQALLMDSDATEAAWQPCVWAKSARMSRTRKESQRAFGRSGLPIGFRHELLSAALAEISGQLSDDATARDLTLHLIATHHGYCRPFAPLALDNDPPPVDLNRLGIDVSLTANQRTANPPYALEAGHVSRFWRVVRQYGWWGAAFLETVLRLADQQASAQEDSVPGRLNSQNREAPR